MNKKNIKVGAGAGVIAGLVFGAMMGMMGMLGMVAKLLNFESVFAGFIVHLIFSAIIGAIFGLLFDTIAKTKVHSIIAGLVYGAIWWVLGPLVIMPVWLGMGVQLSAEGITMAIPSLWGHLVFGFILGLIYPMLNKPSSAPERGQEATPGLEQ